VQNNIIKTQQQANKFMNKKNRIHTIYILLSFLVLIFFLNISFVSALEIQYPTIPFLPNINLPNVTLPQYVSYFFGFLVIMAGAVSLISFTIGAVGLINPNIESHNDAKDRMKGSVLGLVLTLASFIILRTINPILIGPSLTPSGGLAGVYYTNGSQLAATPLENTNTFEVLSKGFNKITYKCADGAYSPALLVWLFSNANLEKGNDLYTGVTTKRIVCGDEFEIGSVGSFKLAFETTGVYYCLGGCSGDICSGYMSNVITKREDLPAPFAQNIKGLRIVIDPPNNIFYGAILHKQIGLENGGACSPLFVATTNSLCVDTYSYGGASAVDIFMLNNGSVSSGDGVTFYSKPYGWDKGQNAGYYDFTATEIISNPFQLKFPDSFSFDYTNVNVPEDYKNSCLKIQDCPGSIKIKGDYLVGLYSDMNANGSGYCQTFIKDVPNLDAEQIIASGGTYLSGLYLIPIK
jgi:hypothetical protein